MDAVIIRLVDLPEGVNGVTVRDEDGDFNIFINARQPLDRQLAAYRHESAHIAAGHFGEPACAAAIEARLGEAAPDTGDLTDS